VPGTQLVYEGEQPMIPLMRTCREVAAMLVAREDRDLGAADRLALRMHMVICEACPKFERQIMTLRNSMQQWRNYTVNEDLNGR
jgi:hypothetical protein